MVKYVTYREDDSGVASYYVLQKAFPHYVGRLVDNPYYKCLCSAPVPQTTLYVAITGTLRGNVIPAYQNVDDEIKSVALDMAYWYYENRILINPSKYKRWLLKAQ